MVNNFSPPSGSPIAAVYYDSDLNQLSVNFRDGTVAYHYPVPADAYQAMLLAEFCGDHYRYRIQGIYPRHDAAAG